MRLMVCVIRGISKVVGLSILAGYSAEASPFLDGPLACVEISTRDRPSKIYSKLQKIFDKDLLHRGGRSVLEHENMILISDCGAFVAVRIIPGKESSSNDDRIGTMVTIIFGKSQWVDWIDADYHVFTY